MKTLPDQWIYRVLGEEFRFRVQKTKTGFQADYKPLGGTWTSRTYEHEPERDEVVRDFTSDISARKSKVSSCQ